MSLCVRGALEIRHEFRLGLICRELHVLGGVSMECHRSCRERMPWRSMEARGNYRWVKFFHGTPWHVQTPMEFP